MRVRAGARALDFLVFFVFVCAADSQSTQRSNFWPLRYKFLIVLPRTKGRLEAPPEKKLQRSSVLADF